MNNLNPKFQKTKIKTDNSLSKKLIENLQEKHESSNLTNKWLSLMVTKYENKINITSIKIMKMDKEWYKFKNTNENGR